MSSHSLPVDSDLAHVDWQQLEVLLDEMARVAKSGVSASEFYRRLLEEIVPVLGVSGGAIWTSGSRASLCLEFQVNLAAANELPSRESFARHQPLVEEVLHSGQPRVAPLVADDAIASGDRPAGWRMLHPFHLARGSSGAIELVERRAATPAAGRAYVRILAAIAELVEDFGKQHELNELRGRVDDARRFDSFAERVHRSLDVRQTAYFIANDGRRAIGCDRASVLVRQGRKMRVVAISGVDSPDRRAKVVQTLEHLAARCQAAGEPVWYQDGTADMPDEITAPLDAYLDESHARAVAIVPLRVPEQEPSRGGQPVIGVLVAEQFQAFDAAEAFRERTAAVAVHSAVALHNALVHERMPLAWLGRLLNRVRWLVAVPQLPKTVLALVTIAAAAACLAWIPADFDIEARGELQPSVRRDVFATDDGIVSQLFVEEPRAVRAGEPLVVLRKPELDLEFQRVTGERLTAEKRLAAVRAERLQDAPASAERRRDAHALAAEEEEIKELLKGLAEQQRILDDGRRDLTIRSPIDGQALTWNVKQLLEARPVQRGQALLTVANVDGPWVLELRVRDDRAGHVLAARDHLRPDLDAAFVLASDPGSEHRGRIAEVALATEMDHDGEPALLVTVEFDKRDVAGLRPGATAIARIHCGRRSLGYVWLRDLIHYVQSLWW